MLSPKRTKYRKYHRGRMRGKATRGNEISFGKYGLQALEPSWITSRQIEATRRTISRYTKRGASLWIRIFPDKTVTARAAESRMGSGKGAVDYWVAIVGLFCVIVGLFCFIVKQVLKQLKSQEEALEKAMQRIQSRR